MTYLSVVIPTRNRADTLRACLVSLQSQTLPSDSFEVIVVDNGSTDNTSDVVRDFTNSLQLVYSYKDEPGLHVGRHEGLRLAKSDLLVYIDDDIKALPCWLEAIAASFADASVAMVGGNNYPDFEVPPPAWLAQIWELSQIAEQSSCKGRAFFPLSILDFGEGCFEIDPGYVWRCNFSIRRDVLIQAGGFHPDAMPKNKLRYRGDGETHVSDFVRAAGLKALFDSRASIYHLVSIDRMTLDYFCHRFYLDGILNSYSFIRATGGVPGPGHALRNIITLAMIRLKYAAKRVAYLNDPVKSQLAIVWNAAQKAYWKGYRFHTREVSNDSEMLRWVLKESYL